MEREELEQRFAVPFAFAVFCFLAAVLVLENLVFGLAGFFAGFVLFFAGKSFLEKSRRKNHALEFEKDLPFALMEMAVQLNLNTQIERVLENIAGKGYGKVSWEFRRAVREINGSGCSVEEALVHLSERVGSANTKRAAYQLINVIDQGGRRNERGEGLKRIAKEMLLRQRSEAKAFGNKLVVFSLVFIAVSAIVPALFQAFLVIGTMFLELEFSAVQVLLIVGIGFPLVDLGVLYFIKSKTPVFLRG